MKKLLIIVSGGIYFITLACILDKNSEEPLLLLHTSLTEFMATVLVQQNLAEKPLYSNYGKAHLNAEVKILATQDLENNVCRGKDTPSGWMISVY